MIRRLQIKFVTITMLATIIISGSIFGLIIEENYKTINRQTDAILNLIAENEGTMPEYESRNDEYSRYINMETKFSTRFFTVEVDDNGEIINTNLNNIYRVTDQNVENIVREISSKSGYYDNFKYKVIEKNGNKMIIFIDCTIQLNSFKSSTKKSIIIIVTGWFVVLLMISAFSKRILRPIIQNIEKQKQFITNASHELKTPLAVITANIDVLEMTMGEENEWIESIKNQTNRLNILTRSLLNLANIEEGKNRLELSVFSINEVIKETINDFKVLLQDKNIEFNSEQNIMIKADENLIRQVIIILLDNAVKYTQESGNIKINLASQGKNTKIEICNTCENTKNINIPRLFDRFYRDDKSRNKKKEGYGIGLSIAKSIIDAHRGKINAYINNEDMMCFRILI